VFTDEDNDNPIIIRPHIAFTDGRQRHPSITRPHIVLTDGRQRQPNHNKTQYVVVLRLGCHCRPSVNKICGHIMIGLSFSSVSKHNMWSYYDLVVMCLLTHDNNDNPIIIGPHIVFTDVREQRQPNHNMTTYCVY
jgi:hypothetical protein